MNDLSNPWGPFSSPYFGTSVIVNREKGQKIDFPLAMTNLTTQETVWPDTTFGYRAKVGEPHGVDKINIIPVNVSPDYLEYTLKYIFEDGDFALARFVTINGVKQNCEIVFHNCSQKRRAYSFLVGVLPSAPLLRPQLHEQYRVMWKGAADYDRLDAYSKSASPGCRQCCVNNGSYFSISSSVLGGAFGCWTGDTVSYSLSLPISLHDGYLYLRYLKYGEVSPRWRVTINGKEVLFTLKPSFVLESGAWGKGDAQYHEWRLLEIPVGELSQRVTFEMMPIDPPGNDRARFWLDGFLFNEGRLNETSHDNVLTTTLIEAEPSVTASFDNSITMDAAARLTCHFEDDDCEILISSNAGLDESVAWCDKDKFDHLDSCDLRPITDDTPPLDGAVVQSLPVDVASGDKGRVVLSLKVTSEDKHQSHYNRAIGLSHRRKPSARDDRYGEMVQLIGDLLFFNVLYPYRIRQSYEVLYMPGKSFRAPFTWDGGFTALGMAFLAPDVSEKHIRFYLAESGDAFPFILAGSPLPIQILAWWELYQQTQNIDILTEYFDGIFRMYNFFWGRTPGSVVHEYGNGFLTTYRYNYNLGPDDHPIQRYAEKEKLTENGVCSIILVSVILRCAKIIHTVSGLLGKTQAEHQTECDIKCLTALIDTRMWSKDDQLYGWLYRESGGEVNQICLHGHTGDLSTYGSLPMFAGLTSRSSQMIAILSDSTRFHTPFGLSSVDMSAPYYNPKGYWNGSLWPVGNWFVWKGLIEAGALDFAKEVAMKIINTWSRSFREHYYVGEHFHLTSEKMVGAPHFSGLTAVLIPLYRAYFKRYEVTLGYDILILQKVIDEDQDILSLKLRIGDFALKEFSLLVVMGKSEKAYTINTGTISHVVTSDDCGFLQCRIMTEGCEMCIDIS